MTQREGTEPRGPVKILTRPVSSQRSDSCKFGGSQSPLATVPRAPAPGPRAGASVPFEGRGLEGFEAWQLTQLCRGQRKPRLSNTVSGNLRKQASW